MWPVWLLLVPGVLLALVLLIPNIFGTVFGVWYASCKGDVREKYRCIDPRSAPEETMEHQLRRVLGGICALLLLGALLVLVLHLEDTGGQRVQTVQRPAFGEGSDDLELEALLNGADYLVQLHVDEQEPDEAEVGSFFAAACQAVLSQVLGDNSDFTSVSKDLNLINSWNEDIRIEWQVSDPQLMSILGEISEDIPEEGAVVQLLMTMTYEEYTVEYMIPVTLWPEASEEDASLELTTYINDAVASASGDKEVELPQEYEGNALVLTTKKSNLAQNLALLLLIAAVLLWYNAGSRLEDAYEKRNRQLELDYPDMVSRLAILLSAGLTIPAAWERLASDYDRELEQGGPMRLGFEELRLTAMELENAGYSGQLFHNFGHRCGSYRYMKLADILEQSMKKGTVQLSLFMEQEAIQAYELRKMQAVKTGEEAGTKLLFPMMLMFGLVIAMVVVPAWSGMNL
jgi:hypothetical protein